MSSLEIAVIGSGISGLSAAWLLSKNHNVTLYEAEMRIGGHAHTVDVRCSDGTLLPVDTGFIVSNTWTYPNFTALMDILGVEMIGTRMSFSVSCAKTGFEYSGDNLATLLGRPRQWINPVQWRLVADLLHFYKSIESKIEHLPDHMTLGQYLQSAGYSQIFIERHILPIAGAIWSSGPHVIAAYPLKAFVRFFANHKLFALGNRPDWCTIKGGSRTYVEKLIATGKFSLRSAQPVKHVMRNNHSVDVTSHSGATQSYDHVVVATHADQALRLLADPSPQERDLLGQFKTSRNRVILHRDASLMPKSRRFWSAWNYHAATRQEDAVAVTYWMNELQKLHSPDEHFVSLNPMQEPAEHLVDREMTYNHPVFTPETLAAQKELWDLQGHNRTWFAGAWFGAGFHEDGLQAGLAVAEQLGGVSRPWSVPEPSNRISVKPIIHMPESQIILAAE